MSQALTRKQLMWAYDKWCVGYTQMQIADALHVDHRTLSRNFKNHNLERIRPVLVYDGGVK